MWKGIHAGYNASTVFNDLGVLIEGLRLLITSHALSFGVTTKRLESHIHTWEKHTANEKQI